MLALIQKNRLLCVSKVSCSRIFFLFQKFKKKLHKFCASKGSTPSHFTEKYNLSDFLWM